MTDLILPSAGRDEAAAFRFKNSLRMLLTTLIELCATVFDMKELRT